jgi:PAS domain S-box-containing protein
MENEIKKDLNSVIEKTLTENKIDIFNEESSKQHLLEELNIYYRELEFQNDELRITQFNLEQTRDGLSDLIENAPVGYVIYDDNFIIQTTNHYFEKMIGFSKADLKGKQLRNFFHFDSQDTFYFHIEKLKNFKINNPVELNILSVNGELTAKIESYNHEKDGKTLYLTALTDITILTRTQFELSKSHNDLNNIVSNSPIHIWKFDCKSFVFANSAMLDFFGIKNTTQISFSLWKNSIHPDDIDAFLNCWEPAMLEKVEFDFEIRLKTRLNHYRNFLCHVVAIFNDSAEFSHFQGYNVDITDKIDSEKALTLSEEKYRLIAENTSDTILLLDNKQFIKYASPTYHLQNNELSVNYNLHSYFHSIHPSDKETIQFALKQAIELLKNELTYTYKFFGKNGEYFWKEDHVKLQYDSQGKHTQSLIVSRDITDRKNSEAKIDEYQKDLKSYAGHLHAVREEERTNLAREIHDDMGQILVALKIEVGILKNELSKNQDFIKIQKSIDAFATITSMVDNIIKTSRRIITGLRPDIIEILGFVDTVKAYIKEFGERNKIVATFSSNIDKTYLNINVELSLFRIIQESLTNVSRHSKATQVDVKLTKENLKLVLNIKDNGVGFDTNVHKKQESYGMIGMKERIFLLSGQLSILSEVGKGTEINIEIPIEIND